MMNRPTPPLSFARGKRSSFNTGTAYTKCKPYPRRNFISTWPPCKPSKSEITARKRNMIGSRACKEACNHG